MQEMTWQRQAANTAKRLDSLPGKGHGYLARKLKHQPHILPKKKKRKKKRIAEIIHK